MRANLLPEAWTIIGPTHLSDTGPLLLSLKDAAKALGISHSTLYQMTNQGDIEWVAVGSRKFVSRQNLIDFIKANTHKGYYSRDNRWLGRHLAALYASDFNPVASGFVDKGLRPGKGFRTA